MNVERRPHGRRRAALVILVLGTLAVGGLWAGTAGESRLPVYPAPTFLADPGWRIEPPGDQAALAEVSEADAIAAATATDDLGGGTKLLSVQLVIFTDDHYGSFDAAGTFHPTIDHRLVWLVRTTGTPVPCLGLSCGPDEPLASELNVVVDAVTGDVLQVASWR